jgi:SagB-type dehydrogenase family enzyme
MASLEDSKMNNRQTDYAWIYHNATKHSFSSIRTNPHYLDWANMPRSSKIYSTLQPILLPREAGQTGIAALSAISHVGLSPDREAIPNLNDLTRILYFSAGITKLKKYPGGEIYFRAASCTGALYEIDLYLVCGELRDLPAGVYHFSPDELALRLLRTGDYRAALVHATASQSAVIHAPVTVVCSGTYWRNAWKYRARTYRHFGWDNGTILANLTAMATALGFTSTVVCGFVDSEVNRLLDLDVEHEVAFSLVPIGHSQAEPPALPGEVQALNYPTVKVSDHEVEYPALAEVHAASSLKSPDEVRQWRHIHDWPKETLGDGIPLPAINPEAMPRDPIEQVILRRGSSREFKREPIPVDQFSIALYAATRGFRADFLSGSCPQLNQIYVIVNAVDGLKPGAYVYDRDLHTVGLLKEGDFRAQAGHLGLDQPLPGDASAAVFFLADLNLILTHFGNRGYRAVQLEAGIIGGKLYLGAYAQHLGATGLTFFDDDVTDFFSPHAAGKSAIFLVALGKGGKPYR